MARLLVFVISFTVRILRAAFRSRADLVIENVALRQQVATLIKQRRRPTLDNADRAFWVALRAAWPRWTNALVIVKTDTMAKWHRERFRRHWANRCSSRNNRAGTSPRLRPPMRCHLQLENSYAINLKATNQARSPERHE